MSNPDSLAIRGRAPIEETSSEDRDDAWRDERNDVAASHTVEYAHSEWPDEDWDRYRDVE